MSETPNDQDLHWLVRPATIRKLWVFGGIILAVITIGDFGVHGHAEFGIDGTFGFFSWYGLAACVAMVLFAKVAGVVLKRKDTYYEPENTGDGDV